MTILTSSRLCPKPNIAGVKSDGHSYDTVLKSENFSLSAVEFSPNFPKYSVAAALTLEAEIRNALKDDKLGQEIIQALQKKEQRHPRVDISECSYSNDLLYIYGLVYVPENIELQRKVIEGCHDHPAAGHPGQASTFELVSRDYWWPGMRKTISRNIKNPDTCARTKPARHAPFGFLKPLEIPQHRWESVSMDFITGLPESNGFNACLVVVDRLTKMAHFIATNDTVTSEGLAILYRDNVFKHHGLPTSFVTDRGSVLTSDFKAS